MSDTSCVGVMGWAFGHRYEPRYSFVEHGRSVETFAAPISGAARERIRRTDKTFLGDVCSRCGRHQPASDPQSAVSPLESKK